MFNSLGVSGGKCETFDIYKAIEEIRQGYPIIMLHLQFGDDNYAWLADAVLVERTPYVVINKRTGQMMESGYRTLYLPHCNWCNYGVNNGYYLPELFCPSRPGTVPDDDSISNDPTHNTFDKDLRMFYGGRVINN